MTKGILANEYQLSAVKFLNRDSEGLAMPALGIAGEAGEVADLIKKHIYHGHPLNREKVLEEVGDVMWYCAAMCTLLDATLSQVMSANIVKLTERYGDKFSSAKSINRVR